MHNDVLCDILERARVFAWSRVLSALALFVTANNLEGLYAKGEWTLVLEHADEVIAGPEVPVRARLLAFDNSSRVWAARGDARALDAAEQALAAGRRIDEFLPVVLTSAALAADSAGDVGALETLVAELADATAGRRAILEDGMGLVRAFAAAGRFDVIRELVETTEPQAPLELPILQYGRLSFTRQTGTFFAQQRISAASSPAATSAAFAGRTGVGAEASRSRRSGDPAVPRRIRSPLTRPAAGAASARGGRLSGFRVEGNRLRSVPARRRRPTRSRPVMWRVARRRPRGRERRRP
jgi:hypothetical protein